MTTKLEDLQAKFIALCDESVAVFFRFGPARTADELNERYEKSMKLVEQAAGVAHQIEMEKIRLAS